MPPQPGVLQVALVSGELPESAPPEGALPIIFADRVVGWATPTIARVEDAEAVAAFRALDTSLGWRVRAVLEPVPPTAPAVVLGGTITSAGEAVSTSAALSAAPPTLDGMPLDRAQLLELARSSRVLEGFINIAAVGEAQIAESGHQP
jgi:hypothetical protein